MSPIKKINTFWTGMDPYRRTLIVKISGLVVAVFAVFSLVSTVSYLFTWKADQSLIGDPSAYDSAVEVANAGGKSGAGWGYMLVNRWFGLGAFAIVVALSVLAVRMIFGRRSFSVIRIIVLSLMAALITSFFLGVISNITELDNVFGGGLGGRCGKVAAQWAINSFGAFMAFVATGILLIIWMVFASRKFSNWFLKVGSSREESVEEEEAHPSEEEVVERKGRFFTWGPKKKDTAVEEDTEDEAGTEDNDGDTVADEELVEVENPSEEDVSVPAVEDASVEVVTHDDRVEPVRAATVTAPAAAGPAEGGAASEEKLEVLVGEELSTDIQEELPRIDVCNDPGYGLSEYRFPTLDLLDDYENSRHEVSQEELKRNNYKIRATLKNFKIDIDNVKAVVGPTVTLYKVYQAPGVKISTIKSLQEDIAMALHAKGVRVYQLEDSVGIEVANDQPSIVPLKALLNDDAFRNSKAELPVAIGYTITQKVKVFDLADAPHLLVAGATKQGKSVGLNVLINSLIYKKHPAELKFVFIDPKMVEFSAYAKLHHHYLAVLPDAGSDEDEFNNAICKQPKAADRILRSLCIEMDARYELLSKALVNNVKLYNEKYRDRHLNPQKGHRFLPYIVAVVDEFADLTMSAGGTNESKAIARSISSSIIRLAQKGRAAGIHVVLATQRPSVDVVTGLIKSNFPTRIAFRVSSGVDSKTIIDGPGADKLIGKGDMIYCSGVDMERIQCAFISNDEINAINDFVYAQQGYMKSYNTPYYLPDPDPEQEEGAGIVDMKNLDERFEEAARQVVTSQRGSTSDLQRKLGMGYAKAGRVMDQLEAAGIVGPQEGSKPRQVLVSDLNELEGIIAAFKQS